VITPSNGTPIGRLMQIGPDGRLRVAGIDKEVQPHRLDADDTSVVVALLDVAARHEDVPMDEAFQQMDVRRAPAAVVPLPTVPPPARAADVQPSFAAPLPPFMPDEHVAFAPPVGVPGPPVEGSAPGARPDGERPEDVLSDDEALAGLREVEPLEPEPLIGADAAPAAAAAPAPVPAPPPVPEQIDADLLAPFLVEVPEPADRRDDRHRVADPVGFAPAPPAPPAAPVPAPTVVPEPPAVPAAAPAAVADTGNAAVVEDPAPVLGLAGLMEGVDVLVRVLGEVQAVRPPRHEHDVEAPLHATRQKGLEAIAYLALRESAVDREDLEINLFPDGANASKTVYNTVSSARALVGEQLFPRTEGGRYELSDRVVTDYGLFCDLVAQADDSDDVDVAAGLLGEALGLVGGEPFTGVGRSYAWVGPHRGMIVAQVVDAAEELAEIRLATGDWRLAEWAARRGLRAFPSDERMYRLLMRAARAA